MSTDSIGNSRDHTSPAAWEAATTITLTEDEIGEWHDDQDWTHPLGVTIAGATVGSYKRQLKAADADAYDPASDSGLWWVTTGTAIFRIRAVEDKAEIGPSIGVSHDFTSSGAVDLITVSAGYDACVIQGMYVEFRNDGNYDVPSSGISTTTNSGHEVFIWNNIVQGEAGTQASLDWGIELTGSSSAGAAYVLNNVCYDAGAGTNGIYWNNSTSSGHYCNNNICMEWSADFNFGSASFTSNDYNCSSDASASGANSITSQTDTDIFTDPGASGQDYTLKTGSNAIGDGIDRSAYFTVDFDGTTRSTWDMGAYYFDTGPVTPASMHWLFPILERNILSHNRRR